MSGWDLGYKSQGDRGKICDLDLPGCIFDAALAQLAPWNYQVSSNCLIHSHRKAKGSWLENVSAAELSARRKSEGQILILGYSDVNPV